jgi:hypothetical protein
MPYCSFATIGLSEMKVKSLRRQVNGSGTIRARKMSISVTKRRKTCKQNNSKYGGHIVLRLGKGWRAREQSTERKANGHVLDGHCPQYAH